METAMGKAYLFWTGNKKIFNFKAVSLDIIARLCGFLNES